MVLAVVTLIRFIFSFSLFYNLFLLNSVSFLSFFLLSPFQSKRVTVLTLAKYVVSISRYLLYMLVSFLLITPFFAYETAQAQHTQSFLSPSCSPSSQNKPTIITFTLIKSNLLATLLMYITTRFIVSLFPLALPLNVDR